MKQFDNSVFERITDELRKKVDFANYVANVLLAEKNYEGYYKALEEGNKYWAELMKVYADWHVAIDEWYAAQK